MRRHSRSYRLRMRLPLPSWCRRRSSRRLIPCPAAGGDRAMIPSSRYGTRLALAATACLFLAGQMDDASARAGGGGRGGGGARAGAGASRGGGGFSSGGPAASGSFGGGSRQGTSTANQAQRQQSMSANQASRQSAAAGAQQNRQSMQESRQ